MVLSPDGMMGTGQARARSTLQPAPGPRRRWGMNRPLAALLSTVLVLSACAATPSQPGDVTLARADLPRATTAPTDALDAGSAVNAFGLDLYRRVAAGATNLVVSPASIVLALAMARAGARGQTATEMDAVLRSAASDEHAGWLNALDAALGARSGTFRDDAGKDVTVTLRIANAPFAQQGMALQQAYLDALATRFGAGIRLVDYQRGTEQARALINGWVDGQTEHRIPELLVPGVLTTETRLALVNAIYLKAPWLLPFEAAATKPGQFTRLDGSTVRVPLMHTTTSLGYAAGTGWEAVEIPYAGGSLAMTVLIPDDLATFEAKLDGPLLAQITGALGATQVDLTFPSFGIETKAELAPVLAALGMPTAFGSEADFSGITTAERLAISNVIHQANIDVDEKGTEAAAATAVVLRATGMPAQPIEVRADRPFLFLLRDLPSGAVLFMGRVADPSIPR